jgi:hypothetical protein
MNEETLDPSSENPYFESLGNQVDRIEQEARMVLPGIQAIFGFQLIAVFNAGFKPSLSPAEQALHLLALLMVAVSAILVVAPAAYHRQAKHRISQHFIQLSSRYLAWAMVPLALGTCLDLPRRARDSRFDGLECDCSRHGFRSLRMDVVPLSRTPRPAHLK